MINRAPLGTGPFRFVSFKRGDRVELARFDGYWDHGLKAWDVAAGLLIVREAGGLVEGLSADETPIETGNLIAANAEIFDAFQKTVRGG